MSKQQFAACFGGLLIVASLAGCAPTPGGSASGPRVAPVQPIAGRNTPKAGDVPVGADTLEGVRRQLEGKWELTSLQAADATGTLVPVAAGGKLSYDAYGNFDLDLEISEAAAKALGAQSAILDLKGRAVIDVAKGSMKIQDATPAAGAAAPENIERVRFYEFQGDVLKLTARDAAGKVTGVTSWRRAS